jgi:HAD superfamily hydrolase (TIGR01509 family)
MLEAVIFDMDGLMIDSEPLWHVAEKESFGAVGVMLSDEQCLETTGLRIDEVVRMRFERTPWTGQSEQAVAASIIFRMAGLLRESVTALPGLVTLLDLLRERSVPLALASSSPMVLIDAALDGLKLRGYFAHVISAQDLPHGKPHPEVYLTAAAALEVSPTRCLALEDSLNGVLAAKAARMACIAVPEEDMRGDPRFAIADEQLASLEQVDAALLRGLGLTAFASEAPAAPSLL